MSARRTGSPDRSSRSLLSRMDRRLRRSAVRLRGQRVLAILGMHRSGTSSLAGSLEEGGLYLGEGDVAGAGRWNRKGNRESKVLMRLHEDILGDNGGSWDDPPAQVAWSDEHRRRRDGFIDSRATQRYWGFKDPRTILLIDGWLEAIPDMAMVATVREPVAVARSLARRHEDDDLGRWLALWLDYNRRLLALHEQHGFPVIDFDLAPEAYGRRLASLMRELHLRPPDDGATFFESSLRSSEEAAPVQPSAEARELHRHLAAIAADQAARAEAQSELG